MTERRKVEVYEDDLRAVLDEYPKQYGADLDAERERLRAALAPACRHCGDPLVQTRSNGEWTHDFGNGSTLYRCQHTVPYGHNAAHPDVPCESLGPINVCACVTERP